MSGRRIENDILGRSEDPPPGKTSIRLGKAYLTPHEERDHFALYRRFVSIVNEGDQVRRHESEHPLLLAIYRKWKGGDRIGPDGKPAPDMRTMHPDTGEPMELVIVWRADSDEAEA